MKVGIVTDTHDDVDRVDKIAKIFVDKAIDLVIHCGDWVAPFIPRRFKGLKVAGILGNNDGDVLALNSALTSIGGELRGRFASLTCDKKKICAVHGENYDLVQALAKSGTYDFVLFGHTHERHEEQVGQTRVINAGVEWVVVYNTLDGKLEFVRVEGTNSVKIRAKYNV